jgi:hypothetical protein
MSFAMEISGNIFDVKRRRGFGRGGVSAAWLKRKFVLLSNKILDSSLQAWKRRARTRARRRPPLVVGTSLTQPTSYESVDDGSGWRRSPHDLLHPFLPRRWCHCLIRLMREARAMAPARPRLWRRGQMEDFNTVLSSRLSGRKINSPTSWMWPLPGARARFGTTKGAGSL